MPQVDVLLTHLRDCGGSDLHLAAGLPPRIRIHGKLEEIDGWSTLDDDALRAPSKHPWPCLAQRNLVELPDSYKWVPEPKL